MMKTLIGLNLRMTFGELYFTKKSKMVLFAFIMVVVTAAIYGILSEILPAVAAPFHEQGLDWFYFALIMLMGVVSCVFTTLFSIVEQLFFSKDNQILLALPLRPAQILGARLISLLIFEYYITLIIAVPAGIVWGRMAEDSAVSLVLFFILMLAVPLLGLAVSCLIGWVIALATARSGGSRKTVTYLLSAVFLIAFYYVYFNMNDLLTGLALRGEAYASSLKSGFFLAYSFGAAVAYADLLQFCVFLAVSLIASGLVFALLAKNFIKITTMQHGAKKKRYVQRELKVSGIAWGLVVKDLRRYSSNPYIWLNLLLGAVILVLGSALLIFMPELLSTLLPNLPEFIAPWLMVSYIIAFCCATMAVTASSISLEGRSLWLVRSLPIRTRTILYAKLRLHLLITYIPVIFASVVLGLLLEVSLVDIVLMMILPLSISLFMGLIGIVLNLAIPNFKWKSELQPIKQGISTMITLFGTLVVVLIEWIIYIILVNSGTTLSAMMYQLITSGLFLLLALLCVPILNTWGVRRFESFEV
jgi:ABC-2 type transport system permease protein